MLCKSIAAAVVPFCLISAATVHAESDPSSAFRDFGLEGVWSPDCGRAPSKENPRVFWRVGTSGPVTHAVTFDGKTFALVDTVSAASRLGENQLRFSVARNGKLALIVTIERTGVKLHTITSIGADGTVYYRNGRQEATGAPSQVDERCDGSLPIS
jgi:hypothetical protein